MKLLVVSGGNHPYHETTPILESFLAAAGHEVTVAERSTILGSQAVGDYDCLVFNTLRAGDLAVEQGLVLTEEERAGMTRFIAGGKGFVCIHVSAQRPDDWPEFHEITGGGWITRVCKHAPYGRFSVDVRQADHPCSQGIAAFETDDELYYECPGLPLQLGWMPGNEVFLTAEYEGKSRPIAWTRRYGEGRVVQTLLGHDGRSFQTPEFQRLILNGVDWVAGREGGSVG